MAFGQQSGLPASNRQLRELLDLLGQAGYGGFREARGPLGFTQRQGLGKFTTDEAASFIERLEAELGAEPEAEAPPEPEAAPRPAEPRPSRAAARRAREGRQAALVREIPARVLAVELEGRGWILIPPEDQTAPEL